MISKLSLFPQEKSHILVSDIGMPEVDGYQFISKVRSLPGLDGKRLPAVALNTYARDEEKTRALNAGFQIHISKPISNSQLISAVASLAASLPDSSFRNEKSKKTTSRVSIDQLGHARNTLQRKNKVRAERA